MTRLAAKIGALARDPMALRHTLWARRSPTALFARYGRLARKAGLDRVYLILSFDCDTDEDIAAVEDVHARVLELGIHPAYAVPGELLKRGASVYRRLFESGAEFLNHGYREHTYFDVERGRYRSCFFYDELAPETVREDIRQGDACLRETLGAAPTGFRTPHFGTYQKPSQLRFLHRVLRELGYRFSTSTVPLYGFRYGPLFEHFGVPEIPVCGGASSPLLIFDSWSRFAAPERASGAEDFAAEGRALAARFAEAGAGFINFYADPSHIRDSAAFFETLARWRDVAEPATYSDIIGRFPR